MRIVQPTRKEEALLRLGMQKIIFEAIDDFAIGSASIKFKLDDGLEQSIKLDLKGQNPRSFRGEYNWKILEAQTKAATQPIMEGKSVIEYWVEIEDTKDAPNGGPNRGVSEHYMIRVVTEDELRGIIANRLADVGSALRVTADEQEAAAGKLHTILLEKAPDPAPVPVPPK